MAASTNNRTVYYEAEFDVIADNTRGKVLNFKNFARLLKFLGYPHGDVGAKYLWESVMPGGLGAMSQEQYITLMKNKEVRDMTGMWRELFSEFDTTGDGRATVEEVLTGLTKIGVDLTPRLRDTLDRIAGADRVVGYEDFLREQLRMN